MDRISKLEKEIIELGKKHERLKKAAHALYMAGKWDLEGTPIEVQATLWEGLRDAAEIPEGTEIARAKKAAEWVPLKRGGRRKE